MAKKNMTAFEKALTDAALSRYQKLLENDSVPVQLSEEHKNAVTKLTKRTNRKSWKYLNTTWKRVLVAVVTILILLASACAAVPAIRDGLIRFFTKDDGVAYTFEFTQDDIDRAPQEIEQFYAPSYVPHQFEMVDEEYGTTEQHRFYLDDTGNVIEFAQFVLWQFEEDPNDPVGIASRFGVTAENATIEDVILQGYEVKVVHAKTPIGTEDVVILWTDHAYFYSISAPYIENEEIDKIIGSMTAVESR